MSMADEDMSGRLSGAEHYAMAQRILARSEGFLDQLSGTRQVTAVEALAARDSVLAEAQAHATLALAAATARATSVQAYSQAAGPHAVEQAAEFEQRWTGAGAW